MKRKKAEVRKASRQTIRQVPHFPSTMKLTIVAHDPSLLYEGRIVTALVDVPAEILTPGPTGHRVAVIDYDASSHSLYEPAHIEVQGDGSTGDVLASGKVRTHAKISAKAYNAAILDDPRFHAQHVFAVVMRTLARFEFALGRRIPWGSDGHQLHVAPHAFNEANAFYSRSDRALMFGYFFNERGTPVYSCLSHDVVAHETTHAILDGLRSRYIEPSSPDQAAFHEGLSDIVAILSIFSLHEVVGQVLGGHDGGSRLIGDKQLTRDALRQSPFFKIGENMGSEASSVHGDALRHSILLQPGRDYMSDPVFKEPHRRGELLVAAMLNSFLDIWIERIQSLGFVSRRMRDRARVVEEGAKAASHLLTMAIRAIDYCPPTDLTFPDFTSALLTVDAEVVPDDTYKYREALMRNFAQFGIHPSPRAQTDGTWPTDQKQYVYARTHFDSMLRDKEEVFRFIWENRKELELGDHGYIEVQSVRPATRIGPDGFVLRETVCEYVQILTVTFSELRSDWGIAPDIELPDWYQLRIYGGGTLVFNEYGQVKYHIANRLSHDPEAVKRQTARIESLFDAGYFDEHRDKGAAFAAVHRQRLMSQSKLP